jgi:hypothetical protein
MSDQRTFASMACKPAANPSGAASSKRYRACWKSSAFCFGRERLWTPPSRHRLDEEPTETRDPEMTQTRKGKN